MIVQLTPILIIVEHTRSTTAGAHRPALGVTGFDTRAQDPKPQELDKDRSYKAAGIVAKLGENVSGLAVGDRVAVEPGKSECCNMTGLASLCQAVTFSLFAVH